ncbi:hypothetical protein KGF54_000856 [Candida jiufengensis]|uniref:uncharacterized protein n=1 Tax=Candida jiufengensis TaxID=497108 RepID=UPI0022240FA7|nr:uncharacterized protein KGF54_000856 [Candida jiufengensis]KAI5956381.1 hypothetical protein KGF54_000856 [Candida jiufengensis]
MVISINNTPPSNNSSPNESTTSSISSSLSTTSNKRLRKIPPEKRQKVSTACDSCKKRKFKCSGSNPCDLCSKKGYECSYTIVDKRSLKSERMLKLKQEKLQKEKEDEENRKHQQFNNPVQNQQQNQAPSSIPVQYRSLPSNNQNISYQPPNTLPYQPQPQAQPMNNQIQGQSSPQYNQLPPPHLIQPQQQPPFEQHRISPTYQNPNNGGPNIPKLNYHPPQHSYISPQSTYGVRPNYSAQRSSYTGQPLPPMQPQPQGLPQQQFTTNQYQNGLQHPPQPSQAIQNDIKQKHEQTEQPQPPPVFKADSGNGMPTPETTPTAIIDNSGSTYVPKSLQPFLSLPIEKTPKKTSNGGKEEEEEEDEEIDEEMENSEDDGAEKDGVSNQAGKSCILLNDKTGVFRYMGETSPLSVLYETRNIFYQYVGKTKLTEDLRGCPVTDKPLKVSTKVTVSLPSPQDRDIYIEQFKRNINDTFFIYDMKKFYKDIVEPVYSNPDLEENEVKRVQLYFVLAIGATYYDFTQKIPEAELGAKFFDSGLYMLQSLVEDSELWCVIVHYLQFHYYQSILKKSTAWIHLNIALKYAQSLGLHRNFVNEQFSKSDECEYRRRIFRSIYSSDRISSVFIGRPLSVNNYDWDDSTRYKASKFLVTNLNFNAKCQIELAKISTLIGKIVANFYQNRIIDINRTKSLAVQLKQWSKNLDPLLGIDNILKPTEIPNNEDGGNTQIILQTHLLQLYAIMLLCRPFFMFDAVSNINTKLQSSIKDKESSKQFCSAATKASILAIKLMNHYINTAFKEVKRMECYVIITCTFYSSIIIGISILNGGFEEEGYSESDLINLLKNGVYVLLHFSKCNKGAERYAEIGIDLIDALVNRNNKKSKTKEEEIFDYNNILNGFNFDEETNNDIQSLMEFQQLFVSQEIAPSVAESSNMPYDYDNYDLFFGDKY